MESIRNLANLASMAVFTLTKGSVTERFVLGSALVGTGIFVLHKVYTLVSRFFSQPHPPVSLPKIVLSLERLSEIERRLNEQFPIPKAVKAEEKKDAPPPEAQPHSLLISLDIGKQTLTTDQEVLLAEALHAYQELKTDVGDEGRFVFLASRYLQAEKTGLPTKLKWEEKNVELSIPSHVNKAFAELGSKLRQVGLSLKSLIRSDDPLAKAHLKNDEIKEIYDLNDLYRIIKLQGPHILSSFEISLRKEQMIDAKKQLHESRLNIVDKTLSTVRAVLIDDLVNSFSEKYKELYAIFGSNPQTLHFVLENICWHALDRALESIEITFIPSKEKLQDARKIDLEGQLKRVLKDEEKRKQAQVYLLQILASPDNDSAMGLLVNLLLDEKESSSEKETLIKKLQEPELQLEEENIRQELARLEAVQKFYHAVTIGAAVADEGKNALLVQKGREEKREKITLKAILASPQAPKKPANKSQKTYAEQIDELSSGVVGAGTRAVKSIVNQRWEDALSSIDQELGSLPDLQSCQQIIEKGWVKFKNREALLPITGHQRWLLTKKMIVQRLAQVALHQKGGELVNEVGKGAASFVKTLYGRLVTALLALDKRTREAQLDARIPKPADRIATAGFDSLIQGYQALNQVKKAIRKEAGGRESEVVRELEKSGDMHPSALNKPSADAVFLGKQILELLSIIQPEGFTADIHKILVNALSQPGESEPTLIRNAIERYNNTIRPAAEPWIKPVGNFLLQALENIIERQSTSNFAHHLSDWLDPVNINAALVDFLKEDETKITISEVGSALKESVKWYREDEESLKNLLQERSEREAKIEAFEKRIEDLKKTPQSDISEISIELINHKKEQAKLDMELAPLLLRRVVVASVDSSFVGYAVSFVQDLFELIQYPRILRHIVFNILEKSVQSLAKPLEENETVSLLDQPLNSTDHQSVFDYLFSDLVKTNLGNKISALLWSISPTENAWSGWGMLTKAATKTVLPGYFVFTRVQRKIEELIQKKYPHAINRSVSKQVVMMNERIQAFAEDRSDKGMTVVIATQLNKVIGIKER